MLIKRAIYLAIVLLGVAGVALAGVQLNHSKNYELHEENGDTIVIEFHQNSDDEWFFCAHGRQYIWDQATGKYICRGMGDSYEFTSQDQNNDGKNDYSYNDGQGGGNPDPYGRSGDYNEK